ncbi:MAG: hypothetical protein KC656_05995 [Myxococcales bacterium]|nr:hypothetical protein [Myxococcales bacterium]
MFCWVLTAALAAEPPPPDWSVVHGGFIGTRLNPLGLGYNGRLTVRRSLEPEDAGVLRRGTLFEFGLDGGTSPTFGTLGPMLRIKPLAVLETSVSLEATKYYGVLGAVMPFDAVDVDYSDPAIKVRKRAGDNVAAFGARLTVSNTLQAQVGRVAVRNITTAAWWKLGVDAVGFYEAGRDLLHPNGGWAVVDDVDVLVLEGPWIAGVRTTYADALFGTGGTGDQATWRAGPLVALKGADRRDARSIQHVTAFMLVQWHLAHPWRAGTTSSQALPLFALAVAWDGELWRTGR